MSSGITGRIAVDAMGGDLGPAEFVGGVKLALEQYPELNPLTLVGDEAVLKPLLAEARIPSISGPLLSASPPRVVH